MTEFSNQGYQEPANSWGNPEQPAKPANNLVLSIVSTVLGLCSPCCIGLILGIVAIVFSTQVDSKYNMGDYAAAEGNAKKARIFAFIAIGLFAMNLVYGIIQFATGGMDAVMQQYEEILKHTR